MADEDGAPPWFQLLRSDLATFRAEVNARLDRLVTTDAFEAERRRVDERHDALGKDLVEEREARVESDKELQATLQRQAAEAATQKQNSENRSAAFRQAVWITAISVAGTAVATVLVLLWQNAIHLG